jgi:hypothetical protein
MLIHEYVELKKLVLELEPDIEKLEYSKTYDAGTRARHKLQEIRTKSLELRKKIQATRKLNKLIKEQNKKNKLKNKVSDINKKHNK